MSVYCPSTVHTCRRDWDEMFSLTQRKSLIAGDFNGHHTNWSVKTDIRGNQIFDSVMDNNFFILNDNTHTRVKLSNGILQKTSPDVTIVSTDLAFQLKWGVMNENLGSDHLIIDIKLDINQPIISSTRRNFKRANWEEYTRKIDSRMTGLKLPFNHQAAYNQFLEIINNAAEECIPSIKICENPLQAGKFLPKPYWNQNLSFIVAQRRLALSRFRRNPTPHNFETLQNKVREAQRIIRQSKRKSFQDFCNSINSSTSASGMWKQMKWFKGYRTNTTIVDYDRATKLLKNLAPDFVPPIAPIFKSLHSPLCKSISVQEVINYIKKTDTAPGQDNVSYSMIKYLPYRGKVMLTTLYNNFLSFGFVPDQWRQVKIIPVPKRNDEFNSNTGTRPIALISCLCKIFHTILTRRLEWFLEKNEHLSLDTVGFRRTKSCCDSLSRLVSRIEVGFSKGFSTVGCFVDIDNAYNNINLLSLLSNLDELGAGSTLCSYLWQYLHQRHLTIRLDDKRIICRTTSIGIPQGDPLSPLLFNVATLKICKNIKNVHILQYADDFILYSSQRKLSDAVSSIQNSLDHFNRMIGEMGLNISHKKTKVCLFNRGRSRENIHLTVDGDVVEQVYCVKYLGMWLDSKLKWGNHVNEILKKSCRFLNIFKVLAGSKWGLHPKHLRRLYIAIIRSRFDYSCYLYGNSANSHLLKLDRVQNQAMRIVGGFIKTTPIHIMESELCLQPLFIRRLYLAAKFYLRSRAFSNNIIVGVLDELSLHCQGPYWRNKKLPLLVEIHSLYKDTYIYSTSRPDIFSLDTWVSSINLNGMISTTIDGICKAKRLINPVELKSSCIDMINHNYRHYYELYTDGSKNGQNIGAAFFDPQQSVITKFRIKANISVMNCELIAISEALSYILHIDRDNFVIYSDSKSSLQHLARVPSSLQGIPIAITILDTISKIRAVKKSVTIQWIPSHIGIMGNEVADLAALQATYEGIDISAVPLHSDLLVHIKSLCRQKWSEYFDERSKSKGIWYKTIQAQPLRYPWFEKNKMDRQHVVALLRMRAGHIPSNSFAYLMGKINSPNCTTCEVREDLFHVLMECVRNSQKRQQIFTKNTDIGACNSILSSPLSEEAWRLCTLLFMTSSGE